MTRRVRAALDELLDDDEDDDATCEPIDSAAPLATLGVSSMHAVSLVANSVSTTVFYGF